MAFKTIELSHQGPVALLALDRPDKLNAIDATMIAEINAALDEIEGNDAIHAVVVHGNGRAFCAGFDLQAGIAANRSSEAEWRAAIDTDLDMIMRFWHCPKPTVAAVHGYALAGGFEIALACDMTVCDASSLFGEPELRFGSSIVALLLPWYVNPKRAKKMLLTGQDRMGASEALQQGIVNEVVANEKYLWRAIELAREAALMDPDSVRMTKRAINQSYEIMGLGKALRMGADTSVRIETLETELRKRFNQILRGEGMKAALAWREARLNRDD
ncbi:MAG: enoyl-CoA hydratase/isomerase family protein [Gammaproteobacteria bacterium]|nr:enoyl-CoA hydratase/isomerase family protein [Gammaproteobacteria bacterium]MDH3536125.1 enoyl-CoA hydratase/isomerase family protein [Gammaproteobacteria bacterium]